ncbi:MAG: hypothetical protein ACJAVK_002225 [Akkermansiaceae bacterium]|jgi:hypothetical protein
MVERPILLSLDFFRDFSVDVGEAEVFSLEAAGEWFVVEAEEVREIKMGLYWAQFPMKGCLSYLAFFGFGRIPLRTLGGRDSEWARAHATAAP